MITFLSKYLSRNVLGQIYKLYTRPHLDCGDIIYHRHVAHVSCDNTKRPDSGSKGCAISLTCGEAIIQLTYLLNFLMFPNCRILLGT